ncbi:HeH/LEM domain-containing protein [Lactobacillus delbrueckii]|uniref:HeH/LEM domain-containing protein n=1 Tax=Lactobacillus delbrueckii TaxID=1584 RepID=UPI0027E3EDEA|nr:HeH/LEM domain-containing protein [Lactobacillus delbrueckii]
MAPVDSGSTGTTSASSTSESTASVGSTSSAGNDTKPTSANTVADIKAYLDAHNISYASNLTKDQLLALVK